MEGFVIERSRLADSRIGVKRIFGVHPALPDEGAVRLFGHRHSFRRMLKQITVTIDPVDCNKKVSVRPVDLVSDTNGMQEMMQNNPAVLNRIKERPSY